MKMVMFNANDEQVIIPNLRDKNLKEIKERYITDTMTNEDIEDLFDLIDFILNRLIDSESARFRNNY